MEKIKVEGTKFERTLLEMKVGERIDYLESITIIRVVGGWLVNQWFKDSTSGTIQWTSTFIPYVKGS